jgi:hypothetical protein
MRPEEEQLFASLLKSQPNFLNVARWVPGPDPPDIVLTNVSGQQLGIELTEWLDTEQTTPSITKTDNKMQWLVGLDSESHKPPRNFQFVRIDFQGR